MKTRIIICVVAAGIALFALSGAAWSAGQVDAKSEHFCASAAHYSRVVMSARQRGQPIEKTMQLATEDGDLHGLLSYIVLTAYRVPRFRDKETRQRAIEEFGKDIYIVCYQHAERQSL